MTRLSNFLFHFWPHLTILFWLIAVVVAIGWCA